MARGYSPNRLPTRRNAELGYIVFATLVVAAAEAIIEITRDSQLTAHVATYALVALATGVVANLAIRRWASYADPLLVPCAVVLVGLGLVMIHRIDLGLAQQASDAGRTYQGAGAASQVVWVVLGLVAFLGVLLIIRDHRVLQRYAYTLALIGLFLLLLPAVLPASMSEINGARIWIRIAGFSIQPGEISKIALTVFAAAYLVAKRDVLSLAGRRVLGIDLPRGRDFGPLLLAWLISIGVLVRDKDLGTSLMFFGLFVVLLYVATERISWVIIGLLLFVGGCYIAYQIFPTVKERVSVWLHVFNYMQDQGYQLSQSLFGLGTGGLFGTGLGGGNPDLVPVAKSDFILSAFGEETGLFGLVAILAIYIVFISRAFATALAVRDSFGKLLVTGIGFSFGLQLFVVAGGISRLLPETGLTTPFLSYGGSSLLANFALLALLIRVSDAARRPPTTPPSAVTTVSGPVPVPDRDPAGPPTGTLSTGGPA
ncbi:FtsW/RodA/SpoVE family cell cycle protein [Jatrophihabitans telluris]|uniref:peptidoglycan glycosyltransferase n=1 Tax=Jatrophihabitans telluris TaxID=2038343 RepID=A0ABY4QYQ3_9ACTN|nr:FtsW/RodA/SpoVE family cell cycle protein [Jatrophihabitans telluris]UQX88630.1 FtsW/RodA/SpoVE family cell cycle protein [Jatrophihabitans telluris]